jgi:maltooligosyltrehalose trehalohydrolase
MHNETRKSGATAVLATDLDGTLIPLTDQPRNRTDLRILADELPAHGVQLVFVTGRHFTSVENAIEVHDLPSPAWIICDVGTSIFRSLNGGYEPIEAYRDHLDKTTNTMPIDELGSLFDSLDGLQLQESEKQGRFKRSYYADAAHIDKLVVAMWRKLDAVDAPYSIIHSVDPFTGEGLIDLLPAAASKAYALTWWARQLGIGAGDIVFAGDSGNDLAALTAGYRTIVVGNAERGLARKVFDAHRSNGQRGRLFLASPPATSGVLAGCRWFGLLDAEVPPIDRLGATPVAHDRTHFRVWAPRRKSIAVEFGRGRNKKRRPLHRENDEYFAGIVEGAGPNSRYRYVLDDNLARPDPASSCQPTGVHGASCVMDPNTFAWTDQDWHGVAKRDLVIYELHVGAFTREGTFSAAIERLPLLVELGISAVEIMPVAQSAGRWNWGYDGVDLFAVRNTYGGPDDFKAFVDACHDAGLAVILDVVYNHVGPEGNYLGDFGPYFSRKHRTPWGDAFNFDGRRNKQVRRFIVENALRWYEEFHLDGLRLDAVHFMFDDSTPTILDELRVAVSRCAKSVPREIHLIAEANVHDDELLSATNQRAAYDAIWCDCLMHSIYAYALPDSKLTRRDYRGAADLLRVLQRGYLYSGRSHARVSKPSSDIREIESFVTALQTHDGVGNHPRGERLHQLTCREFQMAAAALALLYPGIPLLFMGEEHACESPFPFFADFTNHSLRRAVDRGRMREYPRHTWDGAPLPSDPKAFFQANCLGEDEGNQEMRTWYRDLIALRKQGLAEGWLKASRMTADHDVGGDVFSLNYALDNGGAVRVCSRPTPNDHRNGDTVSVPFEGCALLSSKALVINEDGFCRLGPNQTIVMRSTTAPSF